MSKDVCRVETKNKKSLFFNESGDFKTLARMLLNFADGTCIRSWEFSLMYRFVPEIRYTTPNLFTTLVNQS